MPPEVVYGSLVTAAGGLQTPNPADGGPEEAVSEARAPCNSPAGSVLEASGESWRCSSDC